MKGSIFTPFSHNKRDARLLLFFSALNIFLVNLPYVTINFIGLGVDDSYNIMLSVQMLMVFLAYRYIIGAMPEFNMKYNLKMDVKNKLYFLFALIFLVQIFSFLWRIDIVHSGTLPFSPGLILTLVVIVPFYEEVFFRGCLFGGICSFFKGGVVLPAMITSLIFCLMHMQNYNIIDQLSLFISSMIFVCARIITKGLFYPVALHSGMNAVFLSLNMHL